MISIYIIQWSVVKLQSGNPTLITSHLFITILFITFIFTQGFLTVKAY